MWQGTNRLGAEITIWTDLTAHLKTNCRVNLCFSPAYQTIDEHRTVDDAIMTHWRSFRRSTFNSLLQISFRSWFSQWVWGRKVMKTNLQYPRDAPQEKSLVPQASLLMLIWWVTRQTVRLFPGPTAPTFSAWKRSQEEKYKRQSESKPTFHPSVLAAVPASIGAANPPKLWAMFHMPWCSPCPSDKQCSWASNS